MYKRYLKIISLVFIASASYLLCNCTNDPNLKADTQVSTNRLNDGAVVSDVFHPSWVGGSAIEGRLGEKIDLCMNNRVMNEDIESYIKPFETRPEKGLWDWSIEYWGKWFSSAALGYAYQPTIQHREFIDKAVNSLIATRTTDGQITTYARGYEYANWDLWGKRYVMLGLIMHYDFTGEEVSLSAACGVADDLVEKVKSGRLVIGEDGWDRFAGIQSNSIVNELAMLYGRTGNGTYKDLVIHVVNSWDKSNKLAPNGLQLVSAALAGKSALEIGKIGSPKAYEFMACYEGLCELYRVTGDKCYFTAVENLMNSILETERMLHGSLSNREEWFNGVRYQTEILQQPVETCVTATWMNLCWQMLRFTGESRWADELELTLFNALLGAMTPDGVWWSYFTPLTGERSPSQTMHKNIGRCGISCCVTSGPRGLLLTPQWAVMASDNGPVVNLYSQGKYQVTLNDKSTVEIKQATSFPEDRKVKLTVAANPVKQFTLRLRIPGWSAQTLLSVNGKEVDCTPGTYASITRIWSPSDTIVLSLDMRGRVINAPSGAPSIALMRGPLLLSLDSRMVSPDNSVLEIAANANGTVELTPVENKPEGIWMAFSVPFEFYRWPGSPAIPKTLFFCDYQSAGNQFSSKNPFRSWLPQPFNMQDPFPYDTWKLTYDGDRPLLPPCNIN